jgi:hypothetical protein
MAARDLFVDGAWVPAGGIDITAVIDSFKEEVFGNDRVASVSDVAVAVDPRIVKKSKPSQNRGLSGGRVASGAVLRYPP